VSPLLEVEDLEAGYGSLTVLRGISFAVDEGQIVAIVGPNGAGKTTTLRALSGMVSATGKIAFGGESIVRRAPERIARCGIAHVPEGRGTFATLTVEENLRVGALSRKNGGAVAEDIERCCEYFPRLGERLEQPAGSLSGGEQQMLAVARALMLRPRLMLLDEPSTGLAPIITSELFKRLGRIAREEGTTVLVVEQNASLALRFADHAHVLEAGRIALSGEADELRDDEAMQRSYLGY
jgi:branched-chain amino acid transport system ATP-binding protein